MPNVGNRLASINGSIAPLMPWRCRAMATWPYSSPRVLTACASCAGVQLNARGCGMGGGGGGGSAGGGFSGLGCGRRACHCEAWPVGG